jgi:hypothetical protein
MRPELCKESTTEPFFDWLLGPDSSPSPACHV